MELYSDLKVDNRRKVELEVVVGTGIEYLQNIENKLTDIYEYINDTLNNTIYKKALHYRFSNDTSLFDILTDLEGIVAGALSQIQEGSQILNSFNHEYIDNLKDLNEQLLVNNNILSKENMILKQENSNIRNDNIYTILTLLKSNTQRIDNMLNTVEDSIKSIAMNKFIQSEDFKSRDMSKNNNPHYRQDVDNEELIKLYKNGVSIPELQSKYNMSWPGIRNRLIDAGVYKSRRDKS